MNYVYNGKQNKTKQTTPVIASGRVVRGQPWKEPSGMAVMFYTLRGMWASRLYALVKTQWANN